MSSAVVVIGVLRVNILFVLLSEEKHTFFLLYVRGVKWQNFNVCDMFVLFLLNVRTNPPYKFIMCEELIFVNIRVQQA